MIASNLVINKLTLGGITSQDTNDDPEFQSTRHFSDQAFELYELSMLPENEIGEIEAHLLGCGFCCVALDRVSREVAFLRQGLREDLERHQKALQEKKSGGNVLMFRARSTS